MSGAKERAVRAREARAEIKRMRAELETAKTTLVELAKWRDKGPMLRRERDEARRDFVRVADALGLVSTDDTGRIGAVASVERVVEDAEWGAWCERIAGEEDGDA